MLEILPGIYQLQLPMPGPEFTLTYVNAYLVKGKRGYTLVDTGWNTEEGFASLQKQMAEIGAAVKDLELIVITHVHPDHYGLAGRLKELTRAKVAIHDMEKEMIKTRYIDMDKLLALTDVWLAANGVPAAELPLIKEATLQLRQMVTPADPDITFHGGESIPTGVFNFKVIWTPGHSSGHICLYEPEEKVLIVGDHILPTITPNVGSHPQSIDNPLGRYLNSLNDLKKLDIKLVLPGHENPFTNLGHRIDELIQHHHERLSQILAITGGEPKTAYRIAAGTPWGLNTRWEDMPYHHRRLAISETLSHLELMLVNRQVAKITRDNIIYYRQN